MHSNLLKQGVKSSFEGGAACGGGCLNLSSYTIILHDFLVLYNHYCINFLPRMMRI